MSSNSEEVTFCLKVLINKEKNKVLFAEVDSSFADILLSFMTLPLGTIVRLLVNHFADDPPIIGSLNTLYRGLSDLESRHFGTDTGKQILLKPRNLYALLCKKLKLNLDDSEPTKYFTCGSSSSIYVAMNKSDMRTAGKPVKKLDTEVILGSSIIQTADESGGVFTNETATFLVSDNLQVMPNSVGSYMQILNDLGIREMDGLEQRFVIAGFKEIMDLLKGSLVSTTPLSDLIFRRKQMVSATSISQLPHTAEGLTTSKKIIVNAIIRKSTNKVLFVEADEDFINFLFSLLVIPLGRVVHLLGTNSRIGSVDNLYRSVINLDGGRHLKNEDLKSILLKPEVPPEYLSTNHMFSHTEDIIPVMHFPVSKVEFADENGMLGYGKGPAKYMVTDDLVVTPFSAISSIFFLNSFKIPASDVEELEIEIGIKEALNILKASLASTSALTDGLKPISKRQVKQEK